MLVKDYIKEYGNVHFQSVLTKKGKQKLSHPNWIITDMRFPNEMEAVVERGGLTIRVTRLFQTDVIDGNKVSWIPIPGVDYIPHASETALDDAEFDYEIINDGEIVDLIEKVKQILIKEKII